MNTNTLIKGVALALTLAAASVASAQGAQGQNRLERARGAQADSGRGARGQFGRHAMLLRGITLSATQKTRVADLSAQQRTQMEANRPKQNGNRAARPQHERGDTTGFGARREQMQRQRDQHIASIRSMLDNTQRVQFDKNVAELESRVGQGGRGQGAFGGGQKKSRKPGNAER